MVLKGDDGPTLEGDEIFSLKQVSSEKDMRKITDQTPDVLAESENEDDDEVPKKKYARYSKDDTHLDKSGLFYNDSDSEIEMESDDDDAGKEIPEGLGNVF